MIIYVSGTQGAGKSTLIEEICKADPEQHIAYPDRLKFVKVLTPVERQVAKMVKFYQEKCDQAAFATEHPGKIVLADRSFYDGIVYGRAFRNLGWITEEQCDMIEEIARLMMAVTGDTFAHYEVLVNPPFDVVQKRLEHRWAENRKKWKEDDIAYIREAHAEFNRMPSYFRGASLLVLNEEKPLDVLVREFFDWAEEQPFSQEYKDFQAGVDELVAAK